MRLFLLSLLIGACSSPAAVPPPSDPPTVTSDGTATGDLAAARARWAAASLDAYEMTISRSCFCPPEYRGPYVVTVDGSEAMSVLYQGRPAGAGAPPSVEGLFSLLETAYADGAARVDVTYHEDWGYPVRLYIDRDERMADEEIGYEVSELIRR